MSRQFFLNNLWRWSVGKKERCQEKLGTYHSWKHKEQWSHLFETLMRNRLNMGAFRYGPLGEPGKPQYDRCEAIIKRLELYKKTGNLEYLVDIANMALLEFVEGRHPNRHMEATDEGTHEKIRAHDD